MICKLAGEKWRANCAGWRSQEPAGVDGLRRGRTKYSGAWKSGEQGAPTTFSHPECGEFYLPPSRHTNSSVYRKDRASRGIGIQASTFFRAGSIYSTENVIFMARFSIHCQGWLLPENSLSVGLRSNRAVGMTVPVLRRATGRARSMSRYEGQILILAYFSDLSLRFRGG